MSSNNTNPVNLILTTLLKCFAPQQEPSPEKQPHQTTDSTSAPETAPAPMSDQPFSYAAALTSNLDEAATEPAEEEQPTYEESDPSPAAPAASSAYDETAVEEALGEVGDSAPLAASQLWRLDANNRLRPDVDYKINTQYKARSYEEDNASEPFIEYISDSVWEERPTYYLFKQLLNNYSAETGVPERQTQEELQEEGQFLDAVIQSSVGQFTRRWLNEYFPHLNVDSDEGFKSKLYDMWFTLYGRDARGDSSGFEHGFCGEIDDGKVKGLHNFLQVYIEEQRGNFNYKGYLTYGRKRDEYVENDDRMITIRFEWLNYLKPASSMFVGVSPEFEICLYTLLYLSGAAGQTVELGPYDVDVKVYDMHGHVGSSFPELKEVDYNNPDAYLE